MKASAALTVAHDKIRLPSALLGRSVPIDIYLPPGFPAAEPTSLLFVNDGQDLLKMPLQSILTGLYAQGLISPILCVGIHCGEDRKNEYGMIHAKDYAGRGAKAPQYRRFLFEELFPYLESNYAIHRMKDKAFAGFSLGALSALDLVWLHPEVFSRAGVFSGALWWRSVDKSDPAYDDQTCRIMHRQVRETTVPPAVKLFFSCGEMDETEDRNRNGVIDAIDDTIDLMRALLAKGYREGTDFSYLQVKSGQHDVATWARALPSFLRWGWGIRKP